MTEQPHVKRQPCKCPYRCQYCGERLKADNIGHYCPTPNCQAQHGVRGCTGRLL